MATGRQGDGRRPWPDGDGHGPGDGNGPSDGHGESGGDVAA